MTEPSTVEAEEDVYVFPMSFAQERLWFLDQLVTDNPFYNIPAGLRLKGRLDVEALRRSLDTLIERHEVLRTHFALSDGQPVQVIAPRLALELPVIDLGPLAEPARTAEVRRLAEETARQPFSLEQGPLLRARLLRLADDDWVLLSCVHHIVADGWSLGIFIRELTTLYGDFVRGGPPTLPELEIQYADFAVWQREWLRGSELERLLAYWKVRLADAPPLSTFPTDRPRPAAQTFHGGSETLTVPAALTQALKTLGQRQGTSLFMTLLAAFAVLLARYSDQYDVTIGSPIANRNRAEVEPLIGFFVNTLALRVDLAGDPTFETLLQRVRASTLDAYAHQDMPFEKLVDALQPERNLSYAPLFQVMFSLQNAPPQTLSLPGVELSAIDIDKGTALFDLSLIVEESERGLRGLVEYNRDLFEPATIRRLSEHWVTLLGGIVADPAGRISRLPLMGEDERRRLLETSADRVVSFPHCAAVHRLFEAQVRRNPTAWAVHDGRQAVDYRTLNDRANRIARRLRTAGVGPGARVGVCLERSVEMVAGLLAVLKSGAAYLPLDPAYPPARLADMAAGLPMAALLSQADLADALPPTAGPVIDVNAVAEDAAPDPDVFVAPESPAYLIFTSGSTGKPKAAAVSHRGFANLLQWFVSEFGLGPDDSNLLITSLSFDLTQKNIFAPLISGGTLRLYPDSTYDPRAIVSALPGRTWLNCTPSAFYPLLEAADDEAFAALSSLRQVFLGGEPIHLEGLRPWLRASAGKTTLVNTYGPTECTDVCAFQRIAPEAVSAPIGGPIANTRLLVLDRRWQPVPAGVVGELCVAGECVGLGYAGDARASAAAFLPDLSGGEVGGRLYRTGDLVRRLGDGTLEFLGRRDHQIKLRGFRIEPGEIEAVLGRCPALGQAVVSLREDPDPRLIAYVTPAPDHEPALAEIRDYLKERLPNHMVPAAIVLLDSLPLTPSGKVDRRALPAPDPTQVQAAFVAPRTPVEQQVAAIWGEVLRRERIGVHDNFFELGGHSLLATQVNSRLRQVFAVELPLRELFEHVTVATLAERIVSTQLATAHDDDLEALLAEVAGLSDAEATEHLRGDSDDGSAATA
ncbi:MAG: amino acid adenylation domain-containing protein [Gammaproteobacteria bacterium]|nr:amino acid adenylation domain-containing protein [Gammaproteobacteria bacterium]